MKKLDDVFNEVISNEENKEKFLALKTPEEVVEFAKSFGVDASFDEIKAFLREKQSKSGELTENVSDSDLKQVAGGKGANLGEALCSVFSVGVACAIIAGVSVDQGECGTAIEGDAMLCSDML